MTHVYKNGLALSEGTSTLLVFALWWLVLRFTCPEIAGIIYRSYCLREIVEELINKCTSISFFV
jgi:hypothetical protein